MDVILIRHTPVEAVTGICYGRRDVGLAEPCEPAFARVAESLPPLDALVSSPLQRCLRLAQWLAKRERVPLHTDARWQELDFGRWEGQRWDDIGRDDRPLLDRWALDPGSFVAPDGESVRALHLRAQVALSQLGEQAAQAGWQRVGVVTHGGPIRALLAQAMGLGLSKRNALEVPFGHAFALRQQGADGWQRVTLDVVRNEPAPSADSLCAP